MSTALLVLVASGALGAVVGRLLSLPMWPIAGALLGAALANVLYDHPVTMPREFTFTASVLVGTAVGSSVLPGFAREVRRLVVPAVAVVCALVAVGLGCAAALSYWNLVNPRESLLGMVPGGVGEMVAAASALGADSAQVAGLHIIRLLITLWTLPLLVHFASRWADPGGPPDAGG